MDNKQSFKYNVSNGQVNWNPGKDSYVEKLADDAYTGYNFGFGNIGFVITDEGVVVIDSTISPEGGRAVLDEIRKLTSYPIKYLIYTHGHGDHTGGAPVFKEMGATVVGHRNVVERFDRYTKLNEHHMRINSIQFLKSHALDTSKRQRYVYPDITFDKEFTFELGGKTFRLIHGKGETDDHTVVYIPEDRICYVGDFIISNFPNIGNPNKVIRYEREWYEMLDRILKLEPKAVSPGHGPAMLDAKTIVNCLSDTSSVLKFLHNECVKHINQGSSLEQMLAEIKLPEELENSPYIKQVYGCREFVIRGIHRRYTGWFDGNPTHLSPAPTKKVNKALMELVGDETKIINKAKQFETQGDPQMALHMIDLLLTQDPKDKEMHAYKAKLLGEMSAESNNLFFVNFYKGYAKKEAESINQ